MKKIKLAPSILAADFYQLGKQVEEVIAAGADHIHIDVMDGHFVPNISMGAVVVRALRPLATRTDTILDVHLMITQPEQQIDNFAAAGADIITVHVEATHHLQRAIQQIQNHGIRPGVTLNPATPLSSLSEILPEVDLALVMSVNPGYGGQSYWPGATAKVQRLRQMLDAIGSTADLEVDGGIKLHNAQEIVAAGANVLVAGSAIFAGSQSITDNMQAFRALVASTPDNG